MSRGEIHPGIGGTCSTPGGPAQREVNGDAHATVIRGVPDPVSARSARSEVFGTTPIDLRPRPTARPQATRSRASRHRAGFQSARLSGECSRDVRGSSGRYRRRSGRGGGEGGGLRSHARSRDSAHPRPKILVTRCRVRHHHAGPVRAALFEGCLSIYIRNPSPSARVETANMNALSHRPPSGGGIGNALVRPTLRGCGRAAPVVRRGGRAEANVGDEE